MIEKLLICRGSFISDWEKKNPQPKSNNIITDVVWWETTNVIRSAWQIIERDLMKSTWVWRSQLIQVWAAVGKREWREQQGWPAITRASIRFFNGSEAALLSGARLVCAFKVFPKFSTRLLCALGQPEQPQSHGWNAESEFLSFPCWLEAPGTAPRQGYTSGNVGSTRLSPSCWVHPFIRGSCWHFPWVCHHLWALVPLPRQGAQLCLWEHLQISLLSLHRGSVPQNRG